MYIQYTYKERDRKRKGVTSRNSSLRQRYTGLDIVEFFSHIFKYGTEIFRHLYSLNYPSTWEYFTLPAWQQSSNQNRIIWTPQNKGKSLEKEKKEMTREQKYSKKKKTHTFQKLVKNISRHKYWVHFQKGLTSD